MSQSTPLSDTSERIALARNGCQTTLGRLLDDARSYLHHLAACGIDSDVQGKLSASDLVQETLLDAHRNFRSFNGNNARQLWAWMRRILVNNLLNHYRELRDTQKRQISRENVSRGQWPAGLTGVAGQFRHALIAASLHVGRRLI